MTVATAQCLAVIYIYIALEGCGAQGGVKAATATGQCANAIWL